jgi:hypothetical protein
MNAFSWASLIASLNRFLEINIYFVLHFGIKIPRTGFPALGFYSVVAGLPMRCAFHYGLFPGGTYVLGEITDFSEHLFNLVPLLAGIGARHHFLQFLFQLAHAVMEGNIHVPLALRGAGGAIRVFIVHVSVTGFAVAALVVGTATVIAIASGISAPAVTLAALAVAVIVRIFPGFLKHIDLEQILICINQLPDGIQILSGLQSALGFLFQLLADVFLHLVSIVHCATSLTADPNNGDIRVIYEDGNAGGVQDTDVDATAVCVHIMLSGYVKVFLHGGGSDTHQGTAQNFTVLGNAQGDFTNGFAGGDRDVSGECNLIATGRHQVDKCASGSVPLSSTRAADGGGVVYHRLTDRDGLYSGVNQFDQFKTSFRIGATYAAPGITV